MCGVELNEKEIKGHHGKRCRICFNKFSLEKYYSNPELRKRIIEKASKNSSDRSNALRAKIFLLLGNKCSRCGFSDSRILEIDHIYGGGNRHASIFKGDRISYYKDILNRIEGGSNEFQTLCPNCNKLKVVEKREYSDYYKQTRIK